MNHQITSHSWPLHKMLLALPILLCITANTQAENAVGIPSDVRFEMDREAALIRSQEDLEQYLSELDVGYSSLDGLSDHAKEVFLDSLQFGKNGLASFNHSVLEEELTPTQIYAILELFGFQEAIVNMRDARTETVRDTQLIILSDCNGGVASGLCDDGPYVEGQCFGQGTCRNSPGFTCHPPSC